MDKFIQVKISVSSFSRIEIVFDDFCLIRKSQFLIFEIHLSSQEPLVASEMTESEALTQLSKGHDSMLLLLSQRSKHLQTVRAVWTRESVLVCNHIHNADIYI